MLPPSGLLIASKLLEAEGALCDQFTNRISIWHQAGVRVIHLAQSVLSDVPVQIVMLCSLIWKIRGRPVSILKAIQPMHLWRSWNITVMARFSNACPRAVLSSASKSSSRHASAAEHMFGTTAYKRPVWHRDSSKSFCWGWCMSTLFCNIICKQE